MSRYPSLRLAQFWHTRLNPLLTKPDADSSLFVARVFEAVGWLSEGVFSGFFDRREADLVWARFRTLVVACKDPEITMVTEFLRSQVSKLVGSTEPFPETEQMTPGPQMIFELPLFSQALLLADRLATDDLTNACIDRLYSTSDEEWMNRRASWPSIVPAEVVARLAGTSESTQDHASLLAGYLLLLEHMEASQSFFQYAKRQSTRQSDFDSYCERIGGLNAWRVPLADYRGASERFRQLRELFEFATRNALNEELPSAKWSDFEGPLEQHIKSLNATWEAHHLAAYFVTR